MRSVIVFADTNLFLQCRALHELTWSAVFVDVEEILLLIGAPVQDEIDRHKSEGNTRRGRRAREANSLLRKVEETEPVPLMLREQDPRVSIAFAPILSSTRTAPPSLDVRRSDEALIEEALEFVADPGVEICVLTADGGMRRRARRHGLKVIDIPQEWALPPEPTDLERRLRRVEAELAALKHSEPLLTVQILDTSDAAVECVFHAIVNRFSTGW